MGLPQANTVLFFLSAFTGLWGLSVVLRAVNALPIPDARRCPQCKADMRATPGRTCPACAYEAHADPALQPRRHDLRAMLVGILSTAGGIALAPAALWVRRWETTGNDETLSIHPLSAVFYGVAAFGLALAVWAYRGDRSKGRRRCPECWYDMSGSIGSDSAQAAAMTCPECGHKQATVRAWYRPRRRRGVTALGLVLVLIGLYGQTVPRALRTGPVGLVPTTVLIVGMQWCPNSWLGRRGQGSGLLDRLSRGVWGWHARWARSHASGILRHGSGLDRAVLLFQTTEQGPDDAVALHLGVLDAVLNDRIDWDTVSSQEVVLACRYAYDRTHGPDHHAREASPEWEPLQDAVEEALPELLLRLDAPVSNETAVIFTLLDATANRSEEVRDRAFAGLLADAPGVHSAIIRYLAREPDEPDRVLDRALPLLDAELPSTRRAAVYLLMPLAHKTEREPREVLARLEEAALQEPDPTVAGMMIVELIMNLPDAYGHIEQWISAGQFSFDARISALRTMNPSSFGSSRTLYRWIRPILAEGTPDQVLETLLQIRVQDWADAFAREDLTASLDALASHENAVVAQRAADMRDQLQAERAAIPYRQW